jgi:hypothetical protein
MSNLLILSPVPIPAVAASRGSGAMNLLSADPREVWADSASGTAATIDIDLGVVRTIDTIFLGHVLPPHATATWAITAGAATYTDGVLVGTTALRVPDVAGRSPALSHAFWHGLPVAVRYIRLTITQPGGSPALSAGVLLVGASFVPEYPQEWGSGRKPIDTGSVTSLPNGGFAVVEGVRKAAWSWTLGDLTDAELDALWELALDRGESRPLLVVENFAATAGLRRRIRYGLFRQLRAFERSKPNRTRWELTIEDWGADETAPL